MDILLGDTSRSVDDYRHLSSTANDYVLCDEFDVQVTLHRDKFF